MNSDNFLGMLDDPDDDIAEADIEYAIPEPDVDCSDSPPEISDVVLKTAARSGRILDLETEMDSVAALTLITRSNHAAAAMLREVSTEICAAQAAFTATVAAAQVEAREALAKSVEQVMDPRIDGSAAHWMSALVNALAERVEARLEARADQQVGRLIGLQDVVGRTLDDLTHATKELRQLSDTLLAQQRALVEAREAVLQESSRSGGFLNFFNSGRRQ